MRLPFGLQNAPLTFQHLMDEVFEGLLTLSGIKYTWTMYSCSAEDQHLETLLERKLENFLQKGLRLIVTAAGVRPNPEKTDAIRASFVVSKRLGAVNYYRFIENMAEVTKPSTRLLRKGIKFELNNEIWTAVEKCKEILGSNKGQY